jgi:hypothetical protein
MKDFLEKLCDLMRENRIRISQGQSGRFYVHYFDNMSAIRRQEPFKAIKLPHQK